MDFSEQLVKTGEEFNFNPPHQPCFQKTEGVVVGGRRGGGGGGCLTSRAEWNLNARKIKTEKKKVYLKMKLKGRWRQRDEKHFKNVSLRKCSSLRRACEQTPREDTFITLRRLGPPRGPAGRRSVFVNSPVSLEGITASYVFV